MLKKWLIGSLLLVTSAAGVAEELFDIQAMDTLGDIKRKFPNATIKAVKAAWVRENQGFYSLEGSGQPGTLMLAFDDDRPDWRQANEKAIEANSAASEPTDANLKWVEFTQSHATASDDQALTIRWVRWVPPAVIPLERYKSKYGPPDKCGFNDTDMSPYCLWNTRALSVALTDDQKNVLSAEAHFTMQELRSAALRRYGYVPDYLKEPAGGQPVKTSPKSKARPRPLSQPAIQPQ